MKKLSQIIDCDYDIEIKGIKINSKEIEPGDLFVCTKGVNADRHDFIDDAIKNEIGTENYELLHMTKKMKKSL